MKSKSKSIISILLLMIIATLLTTCESSTLRNAKNIEEAKEVVSNQLSYWNEVYQNLCNKSRNDNLKQEFHDLHDAISNISGCGEKCINLAIEEQLEVSDYAVKELSKLEHLKILYVSGKIECW